MPPVFSALFLRLILFLILNCWLPGGRAAAQVRRVYELKGANNGTISFTLDASYCQNQDASSWDALEKSWRNASLTDCSGWWRDHSNFATISRDSLGWNNNHSAGSLNSVRISRVFRRMVQRPDLPLRVYVFGGSMTAGRFVKGREGAWPNEVQKMWNNQPAVQTKKLAPLLVTNQPRLRSGSWRASRTTSPRTTTATWSYMIMI